MFHNIWFNTFYDTQLVGDAIKQFEAAKKMGVMRTSGMFQNLACMYNVQALSETSRESRNSLFEKAEQTFKEGIILGGVSAAFLVDYGQLLIQIGKVDEAIGILQNASKLADRSETCYGAIEKIRLCKALQSEVEKHEDGCVFLSQHLAHYELIGAYKKTGMSSHAAETLTQFKTLLAGSNNPISFSLLGYGHMELRQYTEAASAFSKAASLYHDDDKDYGQVLAKRNEETCLNLSKSIQKPSSSFCSRIKESTDHTQYQASLHIQRSWKKFVSNTSVSQASHAL